MTEPMSRREFTDELHGLIESLDSHVSTENVVASLRTLAHEVSQRGLVEEPEPEPQITINGRPAEEWLAEHGPRLTDTIKRAQRGDY